MSKSREPYLGILVRSGYILWLPLLGETYSLEIARSAAIGLVGYISLPLYVWSVFAPLDNLPLRYFLLIVGLALQVTTRSVSARGKRKIAAWIADDIRDLGHQVSEPVVFGNTKNFKAWLVREKIDSDVVRQAGRIRLERPPSNAAL
jgi:hypothetical protein